MIPIAWPLPMSLDGCWYTDQRSVGPSSPVQALTPGTHWPCGSGLPGAWLGLRIFHLDEVLQAEHAGDAEAGRHGGAFVLAKK